MKPKQLVILLVALAAAGIWAFVASKGREGDDADLVKSPGDKLLPTMAMENIAQVKLTGPETSVHLKKKDGTGNWTVADREGYPADFNKLQKIVKDISDLEVVQTQKVGESKLGRLGLSEPGAEGDLETLGTRVEMLDAEGKDVASLLMGKKYTAGAGDGGGSPTGRYVSTGASGEAYVVSNVFWNLETDPKDWLNKESFSVQKAKSVTVDYPESDTDDFTLIREEEGGDPKFASAKDGEELDTTKASSLINAFSSASFVDVLTGESKANEATGLDKSTKLSIETFEDFKYEILIGKKGEGNRYPVSFTVSAEIAQERTPEPEEKEEDRKAKDEAFENTKTRLTEKLEKEKKLAGNVYLVENWVVNNVLKKRGDLLKTEEEGGDATTPKPGAVTPAISVPPSLQKPEDEGDATGNTEKPKKKITAVTPPISIKDAMDKSKEKEGEGKPATDAEESDESEKPAETEATDKAGEAEAAKPEMKEDKEALVVEPDPEAEKEAKETSEDAAKAPEETLKESVKDGEEAKP